MDSVYELRDSTCEKCGVKFEHVEKEGEKVILRCPKCGGNKGRLKQTGEVIARGQNVKSE